MNLIWAYLIVVIVDHNFAIPSHCYYFTFLWERDDPCNFLFLNTFEFIQQMTIASIPYLYTNFKGKQLNLKLGTNVKKYTLIIRCML